MKSTTPRNYIFCVLKCLVVGLVFVALGAPVSADDSNSSGALQVPHIFGDHMVLQAGKADPVWGWAQPLRPLR